MTIGKGTTEQQNIIKLLELLKARLNKHNVTLAKAYIPISVRVDLIGRKKELEDIIKLVDTFYDTVEHN